jgi:hypothetical protein
MMASGPEFAFLFPVVDGASSLDASYGMQVALKVGW